VNVLICLEHLSDVMVISQSFTAISSRITGRIVLLAGICCCM